ncbi:MAG: MFS transporter [Jatrophihabitans sp.]
MTSTLSRAGSSGAAKTIRRAARPGTILAALLTAQFMAMLDVSVVNVAAPTVRADLGTSGAGLQLVISGYTISYAVLLITGARLGDRLGHGKVFRAGLTVFTVASLLCGLAPTTAALISFRVLQGVGAAAMMPQVMSLIQLTFAGPARARALSLYGAVIACGGVVGYVLGGVLVSADLFGAGWRPVFLVNVPIGIPLWVFARGRLPSDRGEPGRRMDLPGVITLCAAVAALVVPLVLGHEENWPTWCWALLGASVVGFAAFALVERRVFRAGGAPLVSPRVLRAPGLLAGGAALFLGLLNYSGFLFTMALHLQSGLGDSAEHAGLVFTPAAVGFAVTGIWWRRLPAAWHRPMIPAGFVVAALGYAALGLILRGGGSGGVVLIVDLLVIGLALGLAFSPLLTVALTGVPIADAADASGVLVTLFQLGQVVGVATLGTLFLTLVDGPGRHISAHAILVTDLALGASALVAAGFASALPRRRTP